MQPAINNTILVIENNIELRKNVAAILELANYEVETAENGKTGLKLARQLMPALILCDTLMPELDGYSVLRALENIPEMIGTPFIFLTDESEKGNFRRAMNSGADDYLVKPFNSNDLLKAVSTRLKKSSLMKNKFKNNGQEINNSLEDIQSLRDINILTDHRILKKVRKKDVLFMEGDFPNFLYFILSGKIKTFKTNEGGKEYLMEIYKEGDFFGHLCLFGHNKHQESAIAIENTEIALIPKQDFLQLLCSNNEISLNFVKFMASSLSKAEDRLLKLAYNSARKKIAEALLFIGRKYYPHEKEKDCITFPLLRDDLSAASGISPESVSRNLTDFRNEGLIETNNGSIKIIDCGKLEKLRN